MNIIQAILLGIIEGITEFLPISSTAHLIIVSKLLGLAQTEFQTLFEVVIQSGAILAVVFLYIRYLFTHQKVLKNVIVSFIPTAIIGLILQKIIKTIFFQSFGLILFAMVAIAIVFLIVERRIKNNKLSLTKDLKNMDYKEAVFIGLAQALAVVPGVSRAGIIIVYMMMRKYKRSEAAIYSFLLAMPTIIAASVLDLYKSRHVLAGVQNMELLAIGFLAALITAYFAVKWLLGFLQKNTLVYFAYYRLILAIILVLILGI